MRHSAKSFILALFLFLSPTIALVAQKIDAALEKLIKEFPDERTHLHLDKDYYMAGESIWFKAYLYGNKLPSAISSNFYVQLLDKDNRLVSESHYPVMGATSLGTIKIPDSLPKGNYWLRAFTPWMLNFGDEYVYRQSLYVVSSTGKEETKGNTVIPSTINLKFFPESGQLTNGIITTTAFKATYANGMPARVEGRIIAEDGTTITSFQTYHNGMGKTQFKPISGTKYFGEIEVAGKPIKYPLPEVVSAGVNMKVMDEKGGKMFQIARSEKDKDEFNELHLVVVQNKLIVFETDVTIDDYPSVRGHILTNELPTGILQFTLFSKKGVPLAERLSFVNNGDYKSDVSLNMGNVDLGKKQKSNFELIWPDNIQRSLSVSVTDASFGLPNQENIYTRFLLTSNLKGTIYNPAWYFTNTSDSVQQAMDLLMLTNGWTRYRWEKILNDEFPLIRFKDPGMMKLTGLVMDAKGKDIIQSGDLIVYVESPGMPRNSFNVPVNAAGRFTMDSMLLFGSTKISYEYFNTKGKLQDVRIVPDEIKKQNFPIESAAGGLRNEMANQGSTPSARDADKIIADFTVLPEVQLKPVPKKTDSLNTNERYAAGPFSKSGRLNFDFIKDPPRTSLNQNILEYLRQNIPQVQFTGTGFVSRKNYSLNSGSMWPVSVYLDNATTTPSALQGLTISDIALVKFYETGFFGTGTGSSGGTIALFTKKGNDLNIKEVSDKPLPYFMVDGYSPIKEFYRQEPLPIGVANVPPDQSPTLYWNPALVPAGDEKKINIEFYNNDISKKIRIVVEGFDAAGKLIHIEKWIGN